VWGGRCVTALRKRRFRWRLKRKWPLVLAGVLLLAVGTAGAYYVATGQLPTSVLPGFTSQPGRTNVLLLGTDARAGEPSNRTDTMILASVDPSTKQAALVSIPRDTRVDIPGHGMDKINDADVYGGPQMAMSVASNLLGININYYVLANFNGFQDIVTTLGGLTIDVKSNMYHYDPMDGGIYTINLKKGVQHLDGTQALEFVRFRDGALGDIGRTERQQEFLVALLKQMMQPSTLPKLPQLGTEIMQNVQTNLPAGQVLALARLASNMQNLQVAHQTLPGFFETVDGVSYWAVDPNQAQQVAAQVLNGQATVQVVLDTPPDVSQSTYGSSQPVTSSAYGQPGQPLVTKSTGGPHGQVNQPGAPKGVPGASVQFRRLPSQTTKGSNGG